jgi:hypothetical protein
MLATNLVVVEAKRESCTDNAMAQLAACMRIVHTTCKESKENCVVYGASSARRTLRFCRIDNAGVFVERASRVKFPAQRIYSIMQSLLQAAAHSSPTPMKDPMEKGPYVIR